MMKVNDFQKYEVTLKITYESYLLNLRNQVPSEARLCPDRFHTA